MELRARRTVGGLLLGLAAAVVAALWFGLGETQVGYVACMGDQRVYEMGLSGGRLLRVSEPVIGMGRPDSIVYGDGILFVSSGRGHQQNDYHPLLAIDVHSEDFRTVGIYRFGAAAYDPSGINDVGEVYSLALSPSGRRLFVGRADTDAAVLGADWSLGPPLPAIESRSWETMVDATEVFSPDEALLARIRPGGVSVRHVDAPDPVHEDPGVEVSLHPPWGRIEAPLLHEYQDPVTNEHRTHLYDRDSGERIAELDLAAVVGLPTYGPILLPDKGRLATVAADWSDVDAPRHYVALVDVTSERLLSMIEVGTYPSNIALGERRTLLGVAFAAARRWIDR